MKREVYGENKEMGNIEKNDFCDFVCMSKTSERERKLIALTINDSTNMLTS